MEKSYHFNSIIESCGKSMKIHYSDPISGHPEDAARCRLRKCWRCVSVASVVFDFFSCSFKVEKEVK